MRFKTRLQQQKGRQAAKKPFGFFVAFRCLLAIPLPFAGVVIALDRFLTNAARSLDTLGRSAGERGSRNSSQLPRVTARFVGEARYAKCLQRLPWRQVGRMGSVSDRAMVRPRTSQGRDTPHSFVLIE